MSTAEIAGERFARETMKAQELFSAALKEFSSSGALVCYDETSDAAVLSYPVGWTTVYHGNADQTGSPYPADRVIEIARSGIGREVRLDIVSALFGSEAGRLGSEEPIAAERRPGRVEVRDYCTGNWLLCLHLADVSVRVPSELNDQARAFFGEARTVGQIVELDQEAIFNRGAGERDVEPDIT